MSTRSLITPALLLAAATLGGCATRPPAFDYSAFVRNKPASLLVLPPLNDTPDVKATPALWAQATQPLAESGYYVLPVTLVDETLRQNGVSTAADAHAIDADKLRREFGADAAVYIRVRQYGTTYAVLSSDTRVEVEGRVVDLRSGESLWQGRGFATSAEQSNQSQGGLVGLLVTAVVKQIIGTVTDAAYNYGTLANMRLLSTGAPNSMLPGPRSPQAGKVPGTP